MLKAIIFDLDETLLDWSGRIPTWPEHEYHRLSGIYHYVHHQVHPLGDEQGFYEAVIDHITNLWQESRHTLLAPHFGRAMFDVLIHQGVPRHLIDMEACLQAYQYDLVPGVRAYPEVAPILNDLSGRGFLLGIITNALQPMRLRDKELQQLDLLHYFPTPYRISAADVGYLKPHAHIFELLLSRMKVSPQEAVFVGDSLAADIYGAQGVGMKAVWRKQTQEALRKTSTNGNLILPDATIDTLSELPSVLDDLFPGWQG
jgi:putative hydrolase of the HAD superfamily